MIKKFFCFINIVWLIHTLHGEDLPSELKTLGFVEAKAPEPRTKEWDKTAKLLPYSVEVRKKVLVVKKGKYDYKRDPIIFEAGSHKYIGINNGEWFGGLYLNKVDENRAPLFKGNPQYLIKLGDDLYIFEGITHMGLDQGSIHVIRNYKKNTKPEKITLLHTSPTLVLLDEKRFVIVGYDSLIMFHPGLAFDIISHGDFWRSIEPHSIVKYKNHYIIGVRGGLVLAEIGNPTEYKVSYYKSIK